MEIDWDAVTSVLLADELRMNRMGGDEVFLWPVDVLLDSGRKFNLFIIKIIYLK